ncbi:MAG: type I glyceraldehyde-3-phosphate dehydrogenase [SAR202 cluster bacterium]|nr:type I glyceraldehyde-3-phosphate dehydrogenase [SAR202 cluster bacterium]|tara:strand:- start:379 stop:1383 length:1005 start_codon:yes stop_codon:yes gene_type:complete
MSIKIGINGFGRIGRNVFKAIMKYHKSLEIVAINDHSGAETKAHLLKYDSIYGIYESDINYDDENLIVDGKKIKWSSHSNPNEIDWKSSGVDIVIESSGRFRSATDTIGHINGGAKKVIISSPAKNDDITMVLGVNESEYDKNNHQIISNASCTTNCVAPMVKVLNDNFGFESGFMSTIHSTTNDQSILDRGHKDLRRARAAGMNIIPTTTGAAKSVGEIIPELKGKINGLAFRVPTLYVSSVDLVCNLKSKVTKDEINKAFRDASNSNLKNILEITDEPLVSVDFKQNPASCIIDSLSTEVIGENLVKVIGWYDNEWGYSCRTADMVEYITNI